MYLPDGEGEGHWIGHAPYTSTEVDVVVITYFSCRFASKRAPVNVVWAAKKRQNCPITLLSYCIRSRDEKQHTNQNIESYSYNYSIINNYGIVQRLPIWIVQANCEAVVTVTPAEEEFAVTGVAISTPTSGVIVSYHLKGDLARPITYLLKTKVIIVFH